MSRLAVNPDFMAFIRKQITDEFAGSLNLPMAFPDFDVIAACAHMFIVVCSFYSSLSKEFKRNDSKEFQ